MRHMSYENRVKVENTIIRVALRAGLALGWSVTVESYDDEEITKSRKITEIVKALRATDYDNIKFYDKDGKYQGKIFLVHGNDPWEIISDYSISIEEIVKPAMEKAEEIEIRFMYS